MVITTLRGWLWKQREMFALRVVLGPGSPQKRFDNGSQEACVLTSGDRLKIQARAIVRSYLGLRILHVDSAGVRDITHVWTDSAIIHTGKEPEGHYGEIDCSESSSNLYYGLDSEPASPLASRRPLLWD